MEVVILSSEASVACSMKSSDILYTLSISSSIILHIINSSHNDNHNYSDNTTSSSIFTQQSICSDEILLFNQYINGTIHCSLLLGVDSVVDFDVNSL
jgi:hypothetical protein